MRCSAHSVEHQHVVGLAFGPVPTAWPCTVKPVPSRRDRPESHPHNVLVIRTMRRAPQSCADLGTSVLSLTVKALIPFYGPSERPPCKGPPGGLLPPTPDPPAGNAAPQTPRMRRSWGAATPQPEVGANWGSFWCHYGTPKRTLRDQFHWTNIE